MKKIMLFAFSLALLGSAGQLCAQSRSKSLVLDMLLRSIDRENTNWWLKKQVTGATLVIDPVTGHNDVVFSGNDSKTKEFQKKDKEKQIEILKSVAHSIFPLDKKILLVDTSFYIPGELSTQLNGRQMELVREKPSSKDVSYVYLYKLGIVDNNLVISLQYPKEQVFTNYYYKLANNCLEFAKIDFADINPGNE